jgi:hypothetical protein
LALFAMGVLVRELNASRRAAVAGILLLLAAPLAWDISLNLQPEWWQTAFTLLFVASTLRAQAHRESAAKHLSVAAVFLVLAINTKFLALGFAPLLVVAAWWLGRGRLLGCCALAGVIAAALSGLVLVCGTNAIQDGHPLGPRAFRAVHSDANIPSHYLTKAVRAAMLFAEPPDLPLPTLRGRLEEGGNLLAARLSERALPGETPKTRWPGTWRYTVSNPAARFSVAGLVTLLVVVVSPFVLILRWAPAGADSWRAIDLQWLAIGTLTSVFSTIFGVRWMADSLVPDRFLVPGCALAVCWAVTAYERRWRQSSLAGAIGLMVLGWGLWFPLQHAPYTVVQQIVHPIRQSEATEIIADLDAHLPADARVLIVVGQAFGDYAVFGPASGYRRAVFPWGKSPFNAARFEQILRDNRVTYVLVENDNLIDFHWDTAISAMEFVHWLEARPSVREIKMRTVGLRMFQVISALDRSGLPRPPLA